jgi:hypothetical protein
MFATCEAIQSLFYDWFIYWCSHNLGRDAEEIYRLQIKLRTKKIVYLTMNGLDPESNGCSGRIVLQVQSYLVALPCLAGTTFSDFIMRTYTFGILRVSLAYIWCKYDAWLFAINVDTRTTDTVYECELGTSISYKASGRPNIISVVWTPFRQDNIHQWLCVSCHHFAFRRTIGPCKC